MKIYIEHNGYKLIKKILSFLVPATPVADSIKALLDKAREAPHD